MIRSIGSPTSRYLYCAPHTFHLGDDVAAMIAYAAPVLDHVHLADSLDHRRSSGLRYIVNPLGAPVRVHQHLNIGEGKSTGTRSLERSPVSASMASSRVVCSPGRRAPSSPPGRCARPSVTTLAQHFLRIRPRESRAGQPAPDRIDDRAARARSRGWLLELRRLGFGGVEVFLGQLGPGIVDVSVQRAHALAAAEILHRLDLTPVMLNVIDGALDPIGDPDASATRLAKHLRLAAAMGMPRALTWDGILPAGTNPPRVRPHALADCIASALDRSGLPEPPTSASSSTRFTLRARPRPA